MDKLRSSLSRSVKLAEVIAETLVAGSGENRLGRLNDNGKLVDDVGDEVGNNNCLGRLGACRAGGYRVRQG